MMLIDEARHAWRFASVRLAVAAGAIAQWSAMDPQGYASFMESLPIVVRLMVGVIVAGSAISARVIRKGSKADA